MERLKSYFNNLGLLDINMFEYWFWVTVPLALFALVGLAIYATGRHPKKREQFKEETYTCGEPLPDIRVQADNFYQAIRNTLRLGKLRHLHSGDLSDYVLWMVVGLTLILVLVIAL
jgi:hypothetical protein